MKKDLSTTTKRNRFSSYPFSILFYENPTSKSYKRISGIYKIENRVNKKVYIGQSHDIYHRFVRHYTNRFYKNALYDDMDIFGKDTFSFEILKETNELDSWERYYIRLYNATDPKFGYNTTAGGRRLIGKDNPFYGKHHTQATIKTNAEKHYQNKILCIETGEVFNSAREIERKIGANHSHVIRCCVGKQKLCYGFHWKFLNQEIPSVITCQKGKRYYFICKDPIRNDLCRYYILANRMSRHKQEYKNVKIGECIVEEVDER